MMVKNIYLILIYIFWGNDHAHNFPGKCVDLANLTGYLYTTLESSLAFGQQAHQVKTLDFLVLPSFLCHTLLPSASLILYI